MFFICAFPTCHLATVHFHLRTTCFTPLGGSYVTHLAEPPKDSSSIVCKWFTRTAPSSGSVKLCRSTSRYNASGGYGSHSRNYGYDIRKEETSCIAWQ